MPEVGSWKQRVSGIFCHILLLSTIIKFIFQTWNALKEIFFTGETAAFI